MSSGGEGRHLFILENDEFPAVGNGHYDLATDFGPGVDEVERSTPVSANDILLHRQQPVDASAY